MPKYICKVHRNGSQVRLAVPTDIVKDKKWEKVLFVVLDVHPNKKIELRSFQYGDNCIE